jgi:uncharacterized membrane protein (DUF485 family)
VRFEKSPQLMRGPLGGPNEILTGSVYALELSYMAALSRKIRLQISVLAAAAIGCGVGAAVGAWLGDHVVTAVLGVVDRTTPIGVLVFVPTLVLGGYCGIKAWMVLARSVGASEEEIRGTLFGK